MLQNELQKVLDKAVENREIAGGAMLVLKSGKEEAFVCSGKADIENGRDFERDTIVRLYSATKPITAAAALLLMERGQLDLCEEVCQFLPGFCGQKVAVGNELIAVKRNLRVKELLDMVSGLPYGDHNGNPSMEAVRTIFEELEAGADGGNTISTIEVANKIGQAPLSFHPGESWMYGSSADVLGAVVEVVSGMKFGEFLKKEFFVPLGMNDTGFYLPPEKQGRLAKVYDRTSDGLRETPTCHLGISYSQSQQPAFESGGAGLVSTLDDYAKFAAMLMNRGVYNGVRILSEKTVEYMTSASLLPWQQEVLTRSWAGLEGYSYGNLLRVVTQPDKTFLLTTKGEYGWDGWLGFYFTNSPKDGITMLLAVQKLNAGTMPLTRKLKNVVWKLLAE